jgi:DNA-binding response OmpR family regulator
MPARVLVVDDEPEVREHFSRELTRLGCAFEIVETAEDGLVRARGGRFDIVFSDIVLPGMNGLRFLNELAACVPRPLVVIMTAFPSRELTEHASDYGAFLVLGKPCCPRSVEAAIHTARGRRRDAS